MPRLSHDDLLVARFLLKLEDETHALEGLLAEQDSPEYRQALADSDPLLSKRFEQMTLEDRQSTVHDLAMAAAFVHIAQVIADEAIDEPMKLIIHHEIDIHNIHHDDDDVS